ncbi:MAG TPA: hypothetical protein VKU77_13905 [Streptosporangiaceae bacterium]|nr:hypothetical protein [Streptosporangiaceae bacterium]
MLVGLVVRDEVDQGQVGEAGRRRDLGEGLAQLDGERVAGVAQELDLVRRGRGHGVPELAAGPEVEFAHPGFEAVGGPPLVQAGGGGQQLPDEFGRGVVGVL